MREILFRGKAKAIAGCPYNNGKSDGEWVFGYIFPDLGAMKIRQFEPDRPECNDYEVDPETVGQYTGLTDKNGVRIFEGDILKSTIKIIDYADVGFSISHYDEEDIGIVEWRKDGFMIAHKSGTWARSFYGSENYVIGNIHDNPDILKGGEENG